MGFTDSIRTCFAKYATFTGRASRSEYWWWIVFTVIVGFVVSAITGFKSNSFLAWIVDVLLILPNLAVSVRRLHDIGKGGGWIFINLVPFIGWIWYLILMATAGQPYANRFGNPEE